MTKPRVTFDHWTDLWRVSYRKTYRNYYGQNIAFAGSHTTWFRDWDSALAFAVGLAEANR